MAHIEWHSRMEARVAAGVLVLVALSVSAVVFTATRVATRSAVGRASDNLEDARSAFYRLVDDRAAFAAQQTRLIIALPVFRSAMVNPIVAEDVATLTQIADSYRQDLRAEFSILTDPAGTPTATPGWSPAARSTSRVRSDDSCGHRRSVGPRNHLGRQQTVSRHDRTREVCRDRSARHDHVRVPAGRSSCPGACADYAR